MYNGRFHVIFQSSFRLFKFQSVHRNVMLAKILEHLYKLYIGRLIDN